MNIYVLCKRYYTNKDLINDRFGRLYYLPLQLARRGVTVSVSAVDYRNQLETESHAQGVVFRTFPIAPLTILKCLKQIYVHARTAKPDIIIASGDIHLGYLGLQLARRLNVCFVYDIYDYYPAFKINRYPGSTAWFNYAVRKADLALCASEPLMNIVLARLNENAILIENGVDLELFKEMDRDLARKALNIPSDVALIGYFGSITQARGPMLIEACRILRQFHPSLRLLLAGKLTDVCVDEPWIDYFGELEQSAIPTLINACSVVCIPYGSDRFNEMSGACKISEYLACRKPVVATRVSSHEQIFKNVPLALCNTDSIDMARAIGLQLDQPQIMPFPPRLDWCAIGGKLRDALIELT